jgi:branched-chain amino acid aminotransferase
MQIPMEFSMDYFEQQLLSAIGETPGNAHRVRITVFRNEGGKYLPENATVSYRIQVESLKSAVYTLNNESCEIELFKDFYIPSHNLLSNLKTTSKLTAVLGSIWANENGYDNCLLLNDKKNIVEALNGNIFMLTGKELRTPSLNEGCLKGVFRKQVLDWAKSHTDWVVLESEISPFELQKADELWITNTISGITSVSKYRKKEYQNYWAFKCIEELNKKWGLN